MNKGDKMKITNKPILAVVALAALTFAVAVWSPFELTSAQNKIVQTKTDGKSTGKAIPAGTYNLDPLHSVIGFAIRHYEINWVEGRFKDFTGAVNYNREDPTKSTVEFAAKIESIDTGVAPRDQHLRTADFFDAAKYPEMTFKSASVERAGKDGFVLNGDLTIKGVTKRVSLPFTITNAIKDSQGNTRFGIETHGKINRRDFGITYGSQLPGGGLNIGNEVNVSFFLEAVKPEPKPAG